MDRKTPAKAGTKKDILAPKKKPKKAKFKSEPLTETSSKFQNLMKEMDNQPKDAKGKFIDRDFAKYVTKNLKEVRKTSFLLPENKSKTSLKALYNKEKKSKKTK